VTITQSGPTTAEPAPVVVITRSRRRRAVLLVAAALLVAVLGAGVPWINTYQPLSGGNGSYGVWLEPGGLENVVTIDNAFGQEYRVVGAGAGDEITMLFPLDNHGPLGVTILDIGQPFNPWGTVGDRMHIDQTSLGRVTRALDSSEQEWVPLTPFALPAGGHTQIRLAFDVLDCATVESETGSSATTVEVTYRVLGVNRTEQVPLGYAVSIDSLPHCPYL
jgi:hypothetical protein